MPYPHSEEEDRQDEWLDRTFKYTGYVVIVINGILVIVLIIASFFNPF